VDETETPTSALEHYLVASELKRLGVQWVSMAPRYVAGLKKGRTISATWLRLMQTWPDMPQLPGDGAVQAHIHTGSTNSASIPSLRAMPAS